MMSAFQGGDYLSGFASGAAASLIAGGTGKFLQKAGAKGFWKTAGIVASGGLSGGVTSSIAGGRFWDGLRNGVISAGLNHAAHQIADVDPEKLKARILKDGRLTFKEVNKWYRYGKGGDLWVDASKIDLDFLDSSEWHVGQKDAIQTLLRSNDGRVYGHLTLEYLGDDKFIVHDDNYGFELHRTEPDATIGEAFENMFRNAATNVGSSIAGQGTPFWINFYNRVVTIPSKN